MPLLHSCQLHRLQRGRCAVPARRRNLVRDGFWSKHAVASFENSIFSQCPPRLHPHVSDDAVSELELCFWIRFLDNPTDRRARDVREGGGSDGKGYSTTHDVHVPSTRSAG
eukprot:763503-Hanusia_phi.AAC.1